MALLSRRARCAVVASALILATPPFDASPEAQSPAARRTDEYRLKAAIIYNLAKFVEWPAAAFPEAGSPFTVCVVGIDPFGPALETAMQGHSVAGRSIAIRRLIAVEPGCHVLFVSDSEARRTSLILDQIRGLSVLSIGEDTSFLAQGGIVGLTTQGERVRFAIRGEAAEQAHLKVSARVLALSVGTRQGATP